MKTAPRFRIRIEGYDEAEKFCYGCREWLPLTLEFWSSRIEFWRCRACNAERSRLREARKLLDPAGRLANVEKSRRYREYLKAHNLESAHESLRRERYNDRQRIRRQNAA